MGLNETGSEFCVAIMHIIFGHTYTLESISCLLALIICASAVESRTDYAILLSRRRKILFKSLSFDTADLVLGNVNVVCFHE